MKTFWSNNKKKLILILIIILLIPVIIYATTYKYLFTADYTYMGTDGYDDQGQDDLAADNAYDFGADIDLETNGYYGVWITLQHDSSGTTDDIVIGYFSSYDGSNYDDMALFEIRCDASTGADLQQSWGVFPAPPHGKLGVKTIGSTTDTFDYQITLHKVRGDGT